MGRRPRPRGPFHVVTTRQQGKHREYVAHLSRRTYREDGVAKRETVANHSPAGGGDRADPRLRGQRYVAAEEGFRVERSVPAGHFVEARYRAAIAVRGGLPAVPDGRYTGSLILLPLYYALVRHETPLRTGLLLVPQAIGAAISMPLAGFLTDRIGARLVVSCGLGAALAGTLAYTQVGADT